MGESNLNIFFENFLKKESLFLEKKALQSSFIPDQLLHREEQTHQLANILAPALRMEKPSNVFIYGKTGTGKTSTARLTTIKLQEVAKKENIPLQIVYINCKLKRTADTEYRLMAELCKELGKEVPPTGLPTQEIYKIFLSALTKQAKTIIIILDEIDQLVKKTGDGILYSLIRLNEEIAGSQVCIIGISNDLTFIDHVDPRVRSSLSEEEMVFPPYNAPQIQNILKQRSSIAIKPNSIEQGVIEKCAAFAAREHGDVRRALELLRVAGEIAERSNAPKIAISHLDEADEKIDKDRFLDIISTQPKQHQLVLHSILSIQPRNSTIFTGEIYNLYKDLTSRAGLRPLTQRRVSDILGEFDMLGIINAKIISKGRYGRMREISVSLPTALLPKIKETLKEQI